MPDSPPPSRFDTSFVALSSQIACPICYGQLLLNLDRIICSQCGHTYPIVDGIPVLIPSASTKI